VDDRELMRVEAVINSMTIFEREHPDCMSESRILRVSSGCGQPRNKVVELIGRFNTMRGLMRSIGSGKKKALGKLGLDPGLAGMIDEQLPSMPKKSLVDLKKRKNMRKALKKAKRRNR
jgi:signal recognition particle GTPase